MISKTDYKKILGNKSIAINILYYQIKDVESKSWVVTESGSKQQDGTKIPMEALMTYSESFLFEFGAFLDIFIKFILGKDTTEKIYFNLDTLNRITNSDSFIDSLKAYWDNGISNNKNFSLKKMKDYRNAITHATILDLSKHLMWKAGDGIPTLNKNYYILPDNPEAEFGNYQYNERVALFGFLEEMGKIFDAMIKEFNEKDLHSKYILGEDQN